MKITVLCVGKIKEKFYRDAILEYSKRLSRFTKYEIIEVTDEKTKERVEAVSKLPRSVHYARRCRLD